MTIHKPKIMSFLGALLLGAFLQLHAQQFQQQPRPAATAPQAQTLEQRNQLRFAVLPPADDKVWASHADVKFEKAGECVYSGAPNPATTWPVKKTLTKGGGKGVGPLFNPGFALPDGKFDLTGHDDGFNTLFYHSAGGAGAQTMVCRGTILANGKDVTLEGPGRTSSQTIASVSKFGPMTVEVKLDPAKLNAAAAATQFSIDRSPCESIKGKTYLSWNSGTFDNNPNTVNSGQIVFDANGNGTTREFFSAYPTSKTADQITRTVTCAVYPPGSGTLSGKSYLDFGGGAFVVITSYDNGSRVWAEARYANRQTKGWMLQLPPDPPPGSNLVN